MTKYFTLTAGRSGSAWLASFLASNLNIDAIHEPLGIDDFGTKMPDIKIMRTFNNFGNTELVRDFWKYKLTQLPVGTYAETNHTLCKCGLVENIIENNHENDTILIILKRDIIKQCLSYLVRNDFSNITLAWQWYLHPSYTKKIINPEPFLQLGVIGVPLWYCYEMMARHEYYIQKFSDKICMYSIDLEDVTTTDGAFRFHKMLGLNGECILPQPANQNTAKPSANMIQQVSDTVNKINVDMQQLIKTVIEQGVSFEEQSKILSERNTFK